MDDVVVGIESRVVLVVVKETSVRCRPRRGGVAAGLRSTHASGTVNHLAVGWERSWLISHVCVWMDWDFDVVLKSWLRHLEKLVDGR